MTADGGRPATGRTSRVLFAALMLALTALFVALGLWQVQRLAEKQALAATIEARLSAPPLALPAPAGWSALDPAGLDYQRASVTGRFLYDQTVLVFTNLSQPRGPSGGTGYWVVTPLALEGGGALLVNRGFVSDEEADTYRTGGPGPTEPQAVAGVLRRPEQAGAFTPQPDVARRIEWVINVDRLAALMPDLPGPLAPVYLDADDLDPTGGPQGGETVFEFANNHLGYALTWFGFALLTPILLAFWLRRRR